MKPRTIGLYLIIVHLLLSCGTQRMKKDDAERSLKVLNSDLINFGDQVSKSIELNVWAFLLKHNDAPIPFYKNSNNFISVKNFRFNEMRGIYKWKTESNTFEKTGVSEHIVIFPFDEQNTSLQFILYDFQSKQVSSGEPFPTKIKIAITEDSNELYSLAYQAKLSDGMPETINLEMEGTGYEMKGEFLRTRDGDNGKLMVDYSFRYRMKTLIETHLDCTIGYSRLGYFFNTINIDQKLFDHEITGKIDYASIDPTADDYPASFNSKSKVAMFEKYKGKVGEVILASTENGELNDFFVRYSDKSAVRIGDILPGFDKLMNLKY